MAYANGQFPTGATVALATAPGQRLVSPAAENWDALARAVKARYGWTPYLTDSYRPYSVQERIFRERYRVMWSGSGPYGDVRYWQGVRWVRVTGAAAAVPGTSNHGWGKAVDCSGLGGFGGTRFAQLASLAPSYGFTNTEGRSVGEAWHWVFTGSGLVSNPIGGGGSVTVPNVPGAPAPINPTEWDEMASKQEVTDAVVDALLKYRIDGRNVFDFLRQAFADDQKTITAIDGLKTDVANVPSRTVLEVRVDGRNVIDWLKQDRAEQAAGFAALSGQAPASVDTAGLAKAIASQLPDDLARQVANELANRLKG